MASYFNSIGSIPEGIRQVWYLKPGQTIENTKTADRHNALLCSQTAFKHITSHLDRGKRDAEQLQQDQALKTYLKKGSLAMRKNWPNSVENLHKERLRVLQGKRAEVLAKQQQNLKDMLEENETKRKQYVAKMRRELALDSDANKALTSAVVLAETLYERQAQVDFMQAIEGWDQDDDGEWITAMNEDVEKFNQEKEAEKLKEIEKVQKYRELLLEQILERERDSKKERCKQYEEEKAANENMQKLMQDEKEAERQKVLENQRRKKLLNEESLRDKKARDDLIRTQDEQENRINEIYSRAKDKMTRMLKENERNERKVRNEKTAKIATTIFQKFMDKTQQEEDIMAKAVEKANRLDAEERAAKEAFYNKLRETRIQDHKEHLEKEAIKLADRFELERWERINKQKNMEIYNASLIKEHENKVEKMNKNKEVLMLQQAEMQQRDKDAKEQARLDLEYYRECLAKEDRQFLDYAAEVIEDRKLKGRPVAVIERVTEDYKIKNGYKVAPRIQRLRDALKATPKELHGRKIVKPEDDPTAGRCFCYRDRLFH